MGAWQGGQGGHGPPSAQNFCKRGGAKIPKCKKIWTRFLSFSSISICVCATNSRSTFAPQDWFIQKEEKFLFLATIVRHLILRAGRALLPRVSLSQATILWDFFGHSRAHLPQMPILRDFLGRPFKFLCYRSPSYETFRAPMSQVLLLQTPISEETHSRLPFELICYKCPSYETFRAPLHHVPLLLTPISE